MIAQSIFRGISLSFRMNDFFRPHDEPRTMGDVARRMTPIFL